MPMLLLRLKPSLRLTSSKLLPKRPLPRPKLTSSKPRKTPKRLPLMLKLNSRELLPRKLEQSSPPSKLEMMRLLPLLLKLPSKLPLSKRQLLLPLPSKLSKRESLWLSINKFRLLLRNLRDNKLPKLLFLPNKSKMQEMPRSLLSKKLLERLLKPKKRLLRRRKLPKLPLLLPRLLLKLLNRKLMRTKLPLSSKQRLLLSKRDSKERLLILLPMRLKWPKRLDSLPRPKVRSRLLRRDKLPLLLLSRRLRLKDKELRMKRPLLKLKEKRMREELPLLSKLPLMLPIERLLLPIELRNSKLNLLLLKPDLKLTLRLLRLLSWLTPRSSRSKDLQTKLDSRLLQTSKLLKSRLPKKLPKKPTRWLWLLERLKKKDKLPTMLRKWPRESPNSENNSSTYGFQAQPVSPRLP